MRCITLVIVCGGQDNPVNRLILAKRLRLDGHTVVNSTNGQEGLDNVKSDQNFDCVLMDINMPILDGFEATERIREFEKSRHTEVRRLSHQLNGRIPIFALSASLLESERHRLTLSGMDGWILKPIDYKRLNVILKGVTDLSQRASNMYPACGWDQGGWLDRNATHDNPLFQRA